MTIWRWTLIWKETPPEVEDVATTEAEAETAPARPSASESAEADELADFDFDDIGDEALENELNQMLEDENNSLSLEETSEDDEDEIDYLDTADELGTKLDLARAYIDMEDAEGAREILQEVLSSDDQALREEAQKLLDDLGE